VRNGTAWSAGALIFSGRPDPTWALSEARVRDLLELWATLEPLPRVAEEPARLGYRGSFLRGPDSQEWLAFTNTVTYRSPTRTESRRDVNRKFEASLLRTAPPATLPDDPNLGVPDMREHPE
jgi:hypothetical protein